MASIMARTPYLNPWLADRTHPLSTGHLSMDPDRHYLFPACRRLSCPTLPPDITHDTRVDGSCNASYSHGARSRSHGQALSQELDKGYGRARPRQNATAQYHARLLKNYEDLSRSQYELFDLAMNAAAIAVRNHSSRTGSTAVARSDDFATEDVRSLQAAQSRSQLNLDALKATIDGIAHRNPGEGFLSTQPPLPAPEPDRYARHAASNRSSENLEHDQDDTDTDDIPTPLQTYYDTAGWIGILRERLQNLEFEHYHDLGGQKADLPKFKSVAAESAQDFEVERESILQQLLDAKKKAAVYLDICLSRDIDVPHRVPASFVSESDSRLSDSFSELDQSELQEKFEENEQVRITQRHLAETEIDYCPERLSLGKLIESATPEPSTGKDIEQEHRQDEQDPRSAKAQCRTAVKTVREAFSRTELPAEQENLGSRPSAERPPSQRSTSDRSQTSETRQPIQKMSYAQSQHVSSPSDPHGRFERLQHRVDAWMQSAGGYDPKMAHCNINDRLLKTTMDEEGDGDSGEISRNLAEASTSSPIDRATRPQQGSAIECPVCGSAVQIPG